MLKEKKRDSPKLSLILKALLNHLSSLLPRVDGLRAGATLVRRVLAEAGGGQAAHQPWSLTFC